MNDYIKREGAIKAITRKHDEVLSVVEAIEDLESVPSADVVERKKGKWGDNTKDESWKCSECGFIFYSVGFYKIYNTKFRMRFCPNCGADMRETNEKRQQMV